MARAVPARLKHHSYHETKSVGQKWTRPRVARSEQEREVVPHAARSTTRSATAGHERRTQETETTQRCCSFVADTRERSSSGGATSELAATARVQQRLERGSMAACHLDAKRARI